MSTVRIGVRMKLQMLLVLLFVCISAAGALQLPGVPTIPRQAPGQSTASFIVENAKPVAGIGMAVLAAGLIVMILLSLLGNVGLKPSEQSADGAYAPTTVEVHAHKKGKPQTQFISG